VNFVKKSDTGSPPNARHLVGDSMANFTQSREEEEKAKGLRACIIFAPSLLLCAFA
jgi:hypothetical protein